MKIAVIYGSSRPSTIGESVAQWFVDQVEQEDVELEMVDLAEVNLPMIAEPQSPMMGNYAMDTTKAWGEQVAGYDGFVFVLAEYNLGYTPILKNAVDTLFAEWNEKPAALVSYGAYPTSTAAEQFRTVLSAFKMKVSDKSFHVTPVFEALDESGELKEDKVVGDSPSDILASIM